VKPKPKPLLAHEPHPADSADIAEIRANYARRCTGAEPIEYTKDMCDAVLANLNKIDFMRSLARLACTIGSAESYGCRDELAQMKKEKEEADRNAQ
jgi:hypothetical protein